MHSLARGNLNRSSSRRRRQRHPSHKRSSAPTAAVTPSEVDVVKALLEKEVSSTGGVARQASFREAMQADAPIVAYGWGSRHASGRSFKRKSAKQMRRSLGKSKAVADALDLELLNERDWQEFLVHQATYGSFSFSTSGTVF